MTLPDVNGGPALFEKRADGRIRVITLNRPEWMNTIGGGMIGRLVESFLDYRDDVAARVAILTAAGERAFAPASTFAMWQGVATHGSACRRCAGTW